jgi:ABC-2 type transport system permease protein
MTSTAVRVLRQLRRDPRTVAMLLVVPSVLMTLLRYVFDSKREFSSVAPALLGIFPFLLLFLITSIATLRERTSGTLERLMTTPMAKASLLSGYALAFGAVAVAQVAITTTVCLLLGLTVHGALIWLLLVTLADALLGVGLGLLASAFASTEFQAIQMMPLVVLPQLLLCGLFQPRDHMATLLRWAADVLPVTYAVDALQRVAASTTVGNDLVRDFAVLAGFVAASLGLAALSLRRATS